MPDSQSVTPLSANNLICSAKTVPLDSVHKSPDCFIIKRFDFFPLHFRQFTALVVIGLEPNHQLAEVMTFAIRVSSSPDHAGAKNICE